MWLSGLSIAVLETEKWPLEVYTATGSVVTKDPFKTLTIFKYHYRHVQCYLLHVKDGAY